MSEPNKTGNPFGESLTVIISIPQNPKIKYVNASTLSAFELWLFLASITANFATGFWVGYVQTPSSDNRIDILKIIAMAFTLFFLIFLVVALYKRYEMKKEGKEIEFQMGNPVVKN